MAAVNDEVFRLLLDGDEVPIASNYNVKTGILTVPAGFSMQLGHAGLTAEILSRYPMFTPFELYVGDVRVQLGETDKNATVGNAGTEIAITGRDMLKWLVDTFIPSDRTFSEKTYLQLTELALKEVGLEGAVVALDNIANRRAITGQQQVKDVAEPTTEEQQTEVAAEGATRTVYKTLKAELGTTWYNFLSDQYRRAGLFLWADTKGGFVLSRPNVTQTPLYRILRRRGNRMEPGDVTVIGQPQFYEDATKRYTECQVMNRSGGGKSGYATFLGRYIDEEMVRALNPDPANQVDGGKRKKPLIVKDTKVLSVQQANYLARRKIAESRRNGWFLSYKVAGHTAPAILGGGQLVWQPETIVYVVDEELGFDEPMWIESCSYSRTPQTTTELRLMRLGDLVFAEEDDEKKPLKRRIRRGKTEKFSWVRDPQYGNLPIAKWQQADGTWVNAATTDVQNGIVVSGTGSL